MILTLGLSLFFNFIFPTSLWAQDPLHEHEKKSQESLELPPSTIPPSKFLENENSLKKRELYEKQRALIEKKRRPLHYQYAYINRRHKLGESLRLLAGVYGASWALYPLTQPKVFREKGSWKKYRRNFGKLVFDKDEPFWNWFVHPISGSQLYLFYRGNGYEHINAMGMAFISSALFEFTVEIYTEPASIQDLYQTPVLGSFLGIGLEHLSLYLLNSGNSFGRLIGHILNPSSLFWFFEGKIQIIPRTDLKKSGAILMTMEF